MSTEEGANARPNHRAIKLQIGPLKKYDDFQNWRYMLKSSVCADSGYEDVNEALAFVKEVEDSTIDFKALYTSRKASMFKLDMALFYGLMRSLETSIDGMLVTTSIRTKVEFGCGRQALRIIDKFYSHEADRLVSNAMQKLFALRCQNVNGLGEFLTKFQYLEKESGATLGESVKLELLRRDLRGMRDLDALFAVWKNDLNPDSKSLIERLESYHIERREHNRDKPSGRAYQVSGGANNHAELTCHYCNRLGHIKPNCFTFQKDKESGNLKPKGAGKGGKGQSSKGKGKGKSNGKSKGKAKGKGKANATVEEGACEEAWEYEGSSWEWCEPTTNEETSVQSGLVTIVEEKLKSNNALSLASFH